MDKKRTFIAFFWAAGMIYTGHNLIENCIRYKQYNSMTINKYDKNGNSKIFRFQRTLNDGHFNLKTIHGNQLNKIFSNNFSQTTNMFSLAAFAYKSSKVIS